MALSILKHYVLNDQEQEEIHRILTSPIMTKYLISLASEVANTLLTAQPKDDVSDMVYIRNEQFYKGQLAVLETLLSVNN